MILFRTPGIKLFLIFLFFESFFYPHLVWSAACCARSAAVPILIVGDDEVQFNLGMSLASVVGEASSEGIPIFGSPNTSENTKLFRIEGAFLFSDRFQAGVGLNLVNHTITRSALTDSLTGIGDLRVSLGYEILPSWTYSNWKPQGFLFSVVTFPTGRSTYESESSTAADVTGNGFYAFSVGSLFIKRWSRWDVFFVPEVHYSLPRTFYSSTSSLFVEPGFGGSVGLGIGLSPGGGSFRMGFRLQPRVDQAKYAPAMDAGFYRGFLANCDTGLDLAYLLTSNDTVMVSYTDQTLLGPAVNSNLSRVFGLNLQHRWER